MKGIFKYSLFLDRNDQDMFQSLFDLTTHTAKFARDNVSLHKIAFI